jgi:urease alpha subunit
MRKIFLILTITLSLFYFSGCGENHNGEVIDSISMSTGVEYTVYSGDKLISSDGAQITVLHTLSNGTKTVTLVSGTATLIRQG